MSRFRALSVGLFLLVTSVYILAGPGRIDMIDGQYRFDVTHNVLARHSDQLTDRALPGSLESADGRRYSPYSVVSSLLSVPLVWLARLVGPESLQREQVFFSFTSSLFAAGSLVLVFHFYLALGVSPRKGLIWALVLAFATSMLPAGTTVFDQAVHAFFITASTLLFFHAVRRDSLRLALAAGLAMAVAVSIKEVYIALIPALTLLGSWDKQTPRETRWRLSILRGAFCGVAACGLLFTVVVNLVRFSDPFSSVKASGALLNPLGNTLIGLTGLLVSPGKGILFYSPAIILALIGLLRLRNFEPRLTRGVLLVALTHVFVMGSLSFWAGDWSWGPRYVVPIMPLVAIGFPMLRVTNAVRRHLAWGVVGLSFVIQMMGIAVDHHRYFYARSLPPYFWYFDRGFYFQHSALTARPGELLDSIRHGVPPEAQKFRPGPYPDVVTYAVFGPVSSAEAPAWMRQYRVFWLPRPWPLWMLTLSSSDRPIDVPWALFVVVSAAGAGLGAIWLGLRQGEPIARDTSIRGGAIE